jgi:hypothetical protein
MFALAALALLLPAAPSTAITADPPIRLKLSHDEYERGDRARVRVKLAKDGFLLVLRRDGAGHVRVLYPLDPDDAKMVRGGKEFEVRGRGDREAFSVDEAKGTGTILAVRTDEAFDFSAFLHRGRWDYRALSDSLTSGDDESALLDLVDRMTSGRYDYDTATYAVVGSGDYGRYAGRYGGWHGGWYDPWYVGSIYPCLVCGPGFYGPRFGFRGRFGVGFGFGHRRRW